MATLMMNVLLLSTIAAENQISEPHFGLAGWLERLLIQLAQLLQIVLETIAILVVAIALFSAVKRLFHHRAKGRSHHLQERIRLEFGQTLALSLEFQLAADIVATAVSPTWEDVAKLGAIAGIRTFLNFFLQREVQELQEIAAADQAEPEPNENSVR